MSGIKINCKHCRKDITITSNPSDKPTKYYCVLNKMENGECPDNCEWFIPKKMYVV